jgi:hypothetical protein
MRRMYPALVGLLLGLLQTGLYFQLSFALSSSIRTFLLVTVCWLVGSVIGIGLAKRVQVGLSAFILLALAGYFACVILLAAAPFQTQLWPVYAALIVLTGLYPGVFFVRMGALYKARDLFFRENNGFIAGLVMGTLLYLLVGRSALWVLPVVLAVVLIGLSKAVLRDEEERSAVSEKVLSAE